MTFQQQAIYFIFSYHKAEEQNIWSNYKNHTCHHEREITSTYSPPKLDL